MDSIYPGNGACELCGQVDPCDMCAGASTVLKLPQKLIKDKASPSGDANKDLK